MNDLVKQQPAPLAPAMNADLVQEAMTKPLRLLPAEWRPVVWEWWAGWSHLVQNQLALAMRLRRWMKDDQLTLDEARLALARLNTPEREAAVRFASDLLAELAAEVATLVRRRRQAEEQARRREEDERARLGTAPPEELRRALALDRIGMDPGKPR